MSKPWKRHFLFHPGVLGSGAGHVNYDDPLFTDTPSRTGGATIKPKSTASAVTTTDTLNFKSALGSGATDALATDSAIANLSTALTTVVNNVTLPNTQNFPCLDATKTHAAVLWRVLESNGELHEEVVLAYKIPAGCIGTGTKQRLDGYWGKLVCFSDDLTRYFWVWRPRDTDAFLRTEVSLALYLRLFDSATEKVQVDNLWRPYFTQHAAPYAVLQSNTYIVEDNLNNPTTGYWLVVADSVAATSKHRIADIATFDYCGFTAANKVMASTVTNLAGWNAIPTQRDVKINPTNVMNRTA
jgi:hypothetical protein